MLIKLADHLKRNDPLGKRYRGIVVDNNDPLKQDRVKCLVPGLIETTVDKLPWFYAQRSAALGQRKDLGFFGPPRIGAELTVEFPYRDIYAGFYIGSWTTQGNHVGDSDDSYPNAYGFRDDQGNIFKVDLAQRVIDFITGSGSRVQFSADGGVEIRTPKRIRFVSQDDKTFLDFDMATGTVTQSTHGGFTHSGSEGTIDPSVLNVNPSTYKADIGGSSSIKTGAGSSDICGGGRSEATLANKAESVAGSSAKLVGLDTNEVYGLGLTRTIVAGGITDTIVLGNYLMTTLAGLINLTSGTLINFTAAGAASLISGALTTVQGATVIVNGALVTVGPGATPAPVLTTLTEPLTDLITGKPTIGCPTVLAG